jgi:hypothetical protein
MTTRYKFISHARKPWAFKPGDEWHPEAKRRSVIFIGMIPRPLGRVSFHLKKNEVNFVIYERKY